MGSGFSFVKFWLLQTCRTGKIYWCDCCFWWTNLLSHLLVLLFSALFWFVFNYFIQNKLPKEKNFDLFGFIFVSVTNHCQFGQMKREKSKWLFFFVFKAKNTFLWSRMLAELLKQLNVGISCFSVHCWRLVWVEIIVRFMLSKMNGISMWEHEMLITALLDHKTAMATTLRAVSKSPLLTLSVSKCTSVGPSVLSGVIQGFSTHRCVWKLHFRDPK